ncbi:uncharacterized protein LOC143903865 isoform X2 [Temnothorax americanus]|uniref:uncharacterized protein LOC143903865 isoform X2 n=1 Tax=Temnothorax americanus TaxID=1964332 RepID=UPI00406974AB
MADFERGLLVQRYVWYLRPYIVRVGGWISRASPRNKMLSCGRTVVLVMSVRITGTSGKLTRYSHFPVADKLPNGIFTKIPLLHRARVTADPSSADITNKLSRSYQHAPS